jgi:uncharacterized membrane protein
VLQIITESISTMVRPFVTIALVLTLCFIAIRSNIILSNTELVTIVTMVLGFYFGVKSGEATAKALSTNSRRRKEDNDVEPQVSPNPVSSNPNSNNSSGPGSLS